jgi:type I restriction enzyme S subunit
VLVSKLNPHIPRIWLIGDAGECAVCSTEFIVWTPKAPANSAFLYCLASSTEFSSAMRQFVTGTSNSHQRVKPEQLANIRVFTANDETIVNFSKVMEPLMQKLLRNRVESATLGRLRDSLLPRLISGQLNIAQREKSE